MFAYTVITDFSQDEANLVSGRSTVRTGALDAEFSNIQTSIAGLITGLTGIQRDDGLLRDNVVTISALSSEVLALLGSAGFTVRGVWVTATAYAAGNIVKQGTGTYLALSAHTSGVFATDLAAGKWTPLYDTTALTAGAISNTPAGNIAAATVQAAINELDTEKLAKASNLSDVANVATARSNLVVSSKAEEQNAATTFARNTGTTEALVGAYTPAIATLVDGMTLILEATGGNSSTAVTFTPNNGVITALPVVKRGNNVLSALDIPETGARIILSYRQSSGAWEYLNPAAVLSQRQRAALTLALANFTR